MIIVLEGINGCGKSVMAKRLFKRLADEDRAPLILRDPGSSPVGERLRKMLRDPDLDMDPLSQVLLFTAARRQLLPIIEKNLRYDCAVILDRWWFSTYVYQSSLGADPTFILTLSLRAAHLKLDRRTCFFLDVPPEAALERSKKAAKRKLFVDRFEKKGLEFQRELRDRYVELCPPYLTRIDVENKTEDEVFEDIWSRLEPLMAEGA